MNIPPAVLSLGSVVVGFAVSHLLKPALSTEVSAVEKLLGKELCKLSPEEKKMLLDCDKWIQGFEPVAGSKVVAAVAFLVAKVPELAPLSSMIVEILTDVLAAAEQILADEQSDL